MSEYEKLTELRAINASLKRLANTSFGGGGDPMLWVMGWLFSLGLTDVHPVWLVFFWPLELGKLLASRL